MTEFSLTTFSTLRKAGLDDDTAYEIAKNLAASSVVDGVRIKAMERQWRELDWRLRLIKYQVWAIGAVLYVAYLAALFH